MVNLMVINPNGHCDVRTSVSLRQDGDPEPQGSYCEWMPYQKGQAAKAETLENLQQSEAECAAVATAPRVSLSDIEAVIACRYDTTGSKAIDSGAPEHEALDRLSICILVLHNGWTVIGKSAPASAENFNAELGKKLAYEDCIRQLWPLMGFNLRQKLHEAEASR
jgi:Phage protein (N4 Gp49/phage Sf6 gene 66) family